MRLVVIVLAAAVVALGLLTAGATRAPAAGNATLVSFHRSGGFAGVDDRVIVHTDRRVTVRSRGRTRHRRLTVASMRRLRHALAAARLDRPPPAGPGGCDDCFSYEIAYRGHRVRVSENRVPARMRPAIARLSRLID